MSAPIPTILIYVAYYYLVRVIGPRFMANRTPFELRGIKRVQHLPNPIQLLDILWNGDEWMAHWRIQLLLSTCRLLGEQPNSHPDTLYIKLNWLFDTFFLVLRKKERQISGLHLYHHGVMPIFLWSGVRYVCGGHGIFFAFVILNALVHAVMYSYYLIAAMGPRFKKFIWWKKYLFLEIVIKSMPLI